LLLCLYGLGTNAGLKRVAAGSPDVSYDELKHVRRRYIDPASLKAACAQVANATLAIRETEVWGTPGTTCAVSLRRRPSDLGFDPMVSPTLCPTLSTALKSKFFPLPMVIAAGIGQMMTNCALWRKALSATDKRQQQRVGMAFAGRC